MVRNSDMARCPLYPQKGTFVIAAGMSALGQKQTFAASFDHLVGDREKGGRHGKAEHLRGLIIDNELKLAGLRNR
jgi:hypothetical protein